MDENDIHRMIDSQLQVYTDLLASLVSKDSNIFGDPFEEKKNGMSFGSSMVADFLLYIFALKLYLARLFLQWKTNAFTALLPTSTTNSGQASQQLQLADYLCQRNSFQTLLKMLM